FGCGSVSENAPSEDTHVGDTFGDASQQPMGSDGTTPFATGGRPGGGPDGSKLNGGSAGTFPIVADGCGPACARGGHAGGPFSVDGTVPPDGSGIYRDGSG